MDDLIWKKDEKPYVVFKCAKCKQYQYAKTTQKTKKCLRCGRSHQVHKILKDGEIVKGIVNAMNKLKLKQNELAHFEIGSAPDLRAINDFCVAGNIEIDGKDTSPVLKNENTDTDHYNSFNQLLLKISTLYNEFPEYLIHIMAEDFNIPKSELKLLIRRFIIRKCLIPLDNRNYRYCPNL